MDDQGLNLWDILLRMLLRWRLIAVCMLIGALAVDTFSFVKDRREVGRIQRLIAEYEKGQEEKLKDDDLLEESVVALQEFEEELSERQISEVQSVVSMYKMFQRPYTDTVEYINDSIKMQIDPNMVPTLVVQYKIDTHFTVEYPEITKRDYTADILNSIYYRLLNNEILQKLADKLGKDVDSVYARELIGTWTVANDIYCVSVIGRDHEECQALMSIIKESVPDILDSLKIIYGDFDYELIAEEYYEVFNQDMLNAQQSQADRLNGLRNTTNGLINALTDQQKTYFYAILNNDDTVTLELPVEKDMEELTDPNELPMPTPNPFNVKVILIGAVLGALLACVYLFCRLLLSDQLITPESIEVAFEISPLGTLRVSEEPKGFLAVIDKWLIRLLDGRGSQFSPEEHLKMITAGIRLAAAKNGWKSIYLTGTSNDAGTQQAMEQICTALNGEVNTVAYGKSVVYDPESLETMTGSDVAVIVERMDVSLFDEIRSEFTLCKQHKVPVMGYVILK